MNPVGPTSNVQQIIALREQILERNKVLQELRQGQAAPGGTEVGGAEVGSVDFSDTLRDALGTVNAAQQKAASITEAYERGEVHDIAKVMLARQEAGVAFEATLQVRNKLLSAYQEIMRMGV